MLPTTLVCLHLHQNRLVHSPCCHHYYGDDVYHLSGCQNILRPPARLRRCSLGFIEKLARFPSVAAYPTYLDPRPWRLILLLYTIISI